MGRVRFTTTINQWTAETERKLDVAVLEMATDIHRVAGLLAPRDTRALINSGRIERESSAHYKIIFGGGRVPYARIQHEGGVIKPKNAKLLAWKEGEKWHFAKSVTIKGTHYLEKAGDATSRNAKRYLKGI
jgi:hypothetical protein